MLQIKIKMVYSWKCESEWFRKKYQKLLVKLNFQMDPGTNLENYLSDFSPFKLAVC